MDRCPSSLAFLVLPFSAVLVDADVGVVIVVNNLEVAVHVVTPAKQSKDKVKIL